MNRFAPRLNGWRLLLLVLACAGATGCQATEKTNVYQFEQTVTRSERDDADSPPTTESYRRAGFLLFESAGVPANTHTFAEFVLGEAPPLPAKAQWTRTELAAADSGQRSRRTLEWGWPASPTDVIFDATGNDPAVAGAPMPFGSLHLPGVLRADATTAAALDAEPRKVHISWAAAVLPVQYRVIADGAPGVWRVQLDEAPVLYRGRTQLLILKAAGGWRVRAGNATPLPDEVSGKYTLRLSSKRGAGATAVETELSVAEVEFRSVRLRDARLAGEVFTPGTLRPAGD